jgi:hypothetical protein
MAVIPLRFARSKVISLLWTSRTLCRGLADQFAVDWPSSLAWTSRPVWSGICTQDKLGVLIGIDEGCSSARISRYESGIHQPPLPIVHLLAKQLNVPLAYLFCEDDLLAEAIIKLSKLSKTELASFVAEKN